MINLSQLKSFFSQHQFYPRKKLGQNFLIDHNIQQKIIQSCQLTPDDFILEIGAGLGALTKDLSRGANRLVAVEKDTRFISYLKDNTADFKNIKILADDILNIKLRKVFKALKGRKIKVIGNLPYYITTPVIFYLLSQREVIGSIFITIQREVAQRILAKPGSKDCGRLSLSVQYLTTPKLLLNIPKGAFYPQPKVDSSFIKLSVKENPQPQLDDLNLFFKLVGISFSQRRKTILNSLADKSGTFLKKAQLGQILARAQIDAKRRPETLSIEEFAKLSNLVSRQG